MKSRQSITDFPKRAAVLLFVPVRPSCSHGEGRLHDYSSIASRFIADRTTATINHSAGQPYLLVDVSRLSEHGIVNPLTARIYNVYARRRTYVRGRDKRGTEKTQERYRQNMSSSTFVLFFFFNSFGGLFRSIIFCSLRIVRHVNSSSIKKKKQSSCDYFD